MTIDEIAKKLGYKIVSGDNQLIGRDIKGVYACDLLSYAMANIKEGDLWVTVHTNLNVVAVASLTQAACVLVPGDNSIEPQTLKRAEEKGVVFLSSPKSSARVCFEVLSLLGEKL
jgi:hypothetical protein